ncbi:hypothetical protein JQX13_37940 [Archangium violaceum]|uniref:hypothetical protein n=1 Tax=Archangium violaceum TaxID=83451 RepID=UPI00193B897F|nr:hypothetical protein [Archangium violaceum]QRK05879.1 hypothetical protein JQX13_37940 [Archangium violaceum]
MLQQQILQEERLETLENGRKLFRFVVGAGVPVYGFPGNLYAGLTFKVWLLYLNAGFNFRRVAGGTPSSPTQPLYWQGPWTPAFFAGLSLDSAALLAIQEVLPSKSSPL